MIPTTFTVAAILADAPNVISPFGPLILMVCVLGLGFWVVKRLPGWVKKARS